MYLWGPILTNYGTLREFETVYTLDDLVDYNNAINLKSALESAIQEATKNDN